MADYTHMENLLMGEVIRIKERRPPEQWEGELEVLLEWLGKMRQQVLMEKLRAAEQYPSPADESACEDESGDEISTLGSPVPGAVDGTTERQTADNGLVGEGDPRD